MNAEAFENEVFWDHKRVKRFWELAERANLRDLDYRTGVINWIVGKTFVLEVYAPTGEYHDGVAQFDWQEFHRKHVFALGGMSDPWMWPKPVLVGFTFVSSFALGFITGAILS